MSEWWTYRLSSFLLFSPRTYYRLLELYNSEIWPGQVLALLVGLVMLALIRSGGPWQSRIITAALAASWLWVAWAYHYTRYASINWAAIYFAGAFALEALLLLGFGVVKGLHLRRPQEGLLGAAGFGLFVFALVVHPLIGPLVGRSWSQVEIFAIAPDPTVIATLGVLLLASGSSIWLLLPIPLLWCLVSGATAWTMHSADAAVMPVAAGVALAVRRGLPS
ncbi:MAG TPA: DUF6064 family protein [Hyphomicrobiaceae bacterium]|nr:DUF6064 family protein [Hyphomicrobiaceae bacterium]